MKLKNSIENKIRKLKKEINTKDKKYKTKNNIDTIINISIVSVSILIILIIIIRTALILNGSIQIDTDTKQDEKIRKEYESMSKAYSDQEGVYLSININNITTKEKEYNKMKDICNTYIKSEVNEEEINKSDLVQLQTGIKINTNEIYVDNKDNSETFNNTETTSNSAELNETGPIYFQDKLLLRYINDNGLFKIIASDNKDVYNKSELNKLFNSYTEFNEKSNTGKLSEEQYLQEIINIITTVLETNTKDIDKNTKKQAVRYFTYNGYKYIVANNAYNIENGDKLDVQVAEIGKSNINIENKDRIFIQYKLTKKNKEEKLINIVVKLTQQYKVFDIDII